MTLPTLAAYLCFAGCALLIAYVVADLALVVRRLAGHVRNGDDQSAPRAPSDTTSGNPPAVVEAQVERVEPAPSLPTSTPALSVVLLDQCVCGGRLLGTTFDTARLCLSCERITATHGSRCALVAFHNWSTFQKMSRFGAGYGGTC
jgi:hypothetical protein